MPQSRRWAMPPTMIAGFVLLLAMVAGSLFLAVRLSANTQELRRLLDYGNGLNIVAAGARDALIGQRGYLLTGEAQYLQPYLAAIGTIEPGLEEVVRSGRGRGVTMARRLRPVVRAQLAYLDWTIKLAQQGRRDEAVRIIGLSDNGKRSMDEIRAVVEGEWRWRRDQSAIVADSAARMVRQLTFGLIGGLVALVLLTSLWLRAARFQLSRTDAARTDAESALAALRTENAARGAAEGQVRQLQKMESLGQLTGGIAHDFNNMLAIVLGGIELAKKTLRSDPDRAARYLENAREGGTRAAALTGRLLAFSRNAPLAPAAGDANKMVANMSELLQRTLGEEITIETVLAGGLWRSYTDVGQLENAILNLAVNARDAMPSGGKLTIETGNAHLDDAYARERAEVEPGQYVAICVTDTGVGMPPEVIDRAFDPFFTTKEMGKGTGLGLSQVFGFTKQSGGHVAIYSEPGEGTTVKLYLPRFTGVDAADPPSPIDEQDVPRGEPHEIVLVVEDERRVRHFAVDVLNELGYATLSAGSAAEALRLLEENPEICVLFTDIVMPGMNGRRLADAALRAKPDLKVLFTTGYTRNAVVHNGTLDVGVAFLAKPYSIAELARKVRKVIEGKGANRPR